MTASVSMFRWLVCTTRVPGASPILMGGLAHDPAPGLASFLGGLVLKPKQPRVIRRKTDWYSTKKYPHFDMPLSRKVAERLVTNSDAIARHPFLPLMAFEARTRRFRSVGGGLPRADVKIRRLAYCSHRDNYILSYYSEKLSECYEAELKRRELTENVLAYRKISTISSPKASNIDLACSAFDEIEARGRCVAVALDIKGFFDNISHKVLKQQWCESLAVTTLPPDHYAVFRAITKFSIIDRDACLERLGIRKNTPQAQLSVPLCDIGKFRSVVRGGPTVPSLVRPHRNAFGIPQGTPISALAANVSMLAFDTAVKNYVDTIGASYRRYSDDILIIVPWGMVNTALEKIKALLLAETQNLIFSDSKTQIIRFVGAPLKSRPAPLQYLGLTFDGQEIRLRDATLARFWRRMASATRWAKARHRKAATGAISGRDVLHTRSLLVRFTHLGEDNLITSYVKRAHKGAGSKSKINKQVRNHFRILRKMIEKKS